MTHVEHEAAIVQQQKHVQAQSRMHSFWMVPTKTYLMQTCMTPASRGKLAHSKLLSPELWGASARHLITAEPRAGCWTVLPLQGHVGPSPCPQTTEGKTAVSHRTRH